MSRYIWRKDIFSNSGYIHKTTFQNIWFVHVTKTEKFVNGLVFVWMHGGCVSVRTEPETFGNDEGDDSCCLDLVGHDVLFTDSSGSCHMTMTLSSLLTAAVQLQSVFDFSPFLLVTVNKLLPTHREGRSPPPLPPDWSKCQVQRQRRSER